MQRIGRQLGGWLTTPMGRDRRVFSGDPTLGTLTTVQPGGTFFGDGSSDQTNWPQAGAGNATQNTASGPIIVDKYGNIIVNLQRNNGGTKQNQMVYSNDGGLNWTVNTGYSNEAALERGTMAYDAANDTIHVLWTATDAGDGIIYRRYLIAYSSTSISSITKAADNLQLDFQSGYQYQHPILIHMNDGGADGTYGKILAIWSRRNPTGSKNEIAASMCVLGATANRGATAGNWAAPISAATDSLGVAPAVAYSALFVSAGASFPAIPHPSAQRVWSGARANDVYVLYADGGTTAAGKWAVKRMRWAGGSNDWSTGLTAATDVSTIQVAGSDTGYTLKYQLGGPLSHDTTNDRLYFGIARWVSNVVGDAWTVGYIDCTNDTVSSLVDISTSGASYQEGGAAGTYNYPITGGLAYDNTARRFIVTYTKSGAADNSSHARMYNGLTSVGVEKDIYTARKTDIPLIGAVRVNGALPLLWREAGDGTAGSAPFTGFFGLLAVN